MIKSIDFGVNRGSGVPWVSGSILLSLSGRPELKMANQ